ncbi:hypothetical protein D3C86_1619250 [compost metagenome]
MAWPVAASQQPVTHHRPLQLRRPATRHAEPGRRRSAEASARRYPQWRETATALSTDDADPGARLAAPGPNCRRWIQPGPAPPPAASQDFRPAGTAACPSLRRFPPGCRSIRPERRRHANRRSMRAAHRRLQVAPVHAAVPGPCPDTPAAQVRQHRRHAALASYPQPVASPVPPPAHPAPRDVAGRRSGGRRWTPG